MYRVEPDPTVAEQIGALPYDVLPYDVLLGVMKLAPGRACPSTRPTLTRRCGSCSSVPTVRGW